MRTVRLAIFDLDGTLCDTAPDLADALNFSLAQVGLPTLPEAAVRKMIGDGVAVLIERALGSKQDQFDIALRAFRERYGAHLCDRTRLYEGIPALLAEIRCPKAVATNKPGHWARAICERLGVISQFSVVLGDGDGPRRKPDPEMVEAIVAEANVPKSEVLLIGDGLTDVEAGRRAGIHVCAIGWGYTDEATLRAAGPGQFAADVPALRRVVGLP